MSITLSRLIHSIFENQCFFVNPILIQIKVHSYSFKLSTNQFQGVGPNRAAIISLPDDAAATASSNVNDLTKSNKWIPQALLRSHQNANGNLSRTQDDKDNEVFSSMSCSPQQINTGKIR